MNLVAGSPFWTVRNGLIASYPTLESSVDCDVAVLGAGITGAMAAWHLVMAGHDVVVVDKQDVATGSTSASTSLLQYELDIPLYQLADLVGCNHAIRAYQACRASLNQIARLDRLLGGGHGFEWREALQGASRGAHVSGLRREFKMRQLHGFDVDWWSRRQLARASTLPYPAALLSRDAAQIDAHRFTHSLLRAAAARGARIYDRTRISRRKPAHQGVRLQTDRGFEIRSRHLVVATGYATAPYLSRSRTKLLATYALVTEPQIEYAGWPGNRLIWETGRPYLYLRQTDDGRAIIGGYDDTPSDPTRSAHLLRQKTGALARRFRQLFPQARCDVAYSWAGTFAETPDGLPYIGLHPRVPHTFFALGYGGNGITFSLIAAEIIRDLICEGDSRDAELFRFNRSTVLRAKA